MAAASCASSNSGSGNGVWNPALVENLIFRQFLKGEDVSNDVPAKVEEQRLPEQDPCVRAFFKYVDSMGPAPLSRQAPQQQQQQQQQMMTMMPQSGGAGTPLRPQQAAAMKGAAIGAPMLAAPPAGTPRSNNNNNNGMAAANSKSMPRTPRLNNNGRGQSESNAANSGMPAPHHDAMRRRRVEWPGGVPTDAQLKNAQRGALQPLAERRVMAQAEVDPDLFFRQDNSEFPLNRIFAMHPQALKLISQTRGLSGDWRNDTFRPEEEAEYKVAMGFTVLGSSQAQPMAFSLQPQLM